jgi:hypothetical protein
VRSPLGPRRLAHLRRRLRLRCADPAPGPAAWIGPHRPGPGTGRRKERKGGHRRRARSRQGGSARERPNSGSRDYGRWSLVPGNVLKYGTWLVTRSENRLKDRIPSRWKIVFHFFAECHATWYLISCSVFSFKKKVALWEYGSDFVNGRICTFPWVWSMGGNDSVLK